MGFNNGGDTDAWIGRITGAEMDAVQAYTGKDYDLINYNLRHGVGSSYTDPLIENIESAINKYELSRTTIFSRNSSASLLGGVSDAAEIQKMVGQVVHDRGFTSTSTQKNPDMNGSIMYHIKTRPGKGIGAFVKPMSKFPGEDEFLFNRGSGFKITGAYTKGKYTHVNMEYVGRM